MDEEKSEFDKIFNNNDLDDASTHLLKLFAEGQVLKDILDVPDETMHERYAYGRELFEKKEFDEAAEVFGHLLTLDPLDKNYWIGMAYSKVQANDLEPAIAAFSVASILDPDDPQSYYNAGLAYLSLQQPEEALASFRLAAESAQKEYCHRSIEEMAQHWIEELA